MFHRSPDNTHIPTQGSDPASQFQPANPFEAFAVLRAANEIPAVSPEIEEFRQKALTVVDQTVLRAQPIPSAIPVVERPAVKREIGALDTFTGLSFEAEDRSMEGLDASVSDKSDISPEERADRLLASYEARTNPVTFTPAESAIAVTALIKYSEQASDDYARLTAQLVLKQHGIDPL